MNKVTMQSEKYPYDMSAWCREKSENVVKQLTGIIEILKKDRHSMPEDVYEAITSHLHPALIDAAKIYGFSYGAELKGNEGSIIFNEGKDGLEKIQVAIGKLEKTTKQKQYDNLQTLITQLNSLLEGDRTNRTLVHIALSQYNDGISSISEDIEELKKTIECVTNAEMLWEDFVTNAKQIVLRLERVLKGLNI